MPAHVALVPALAYAVLVLVQAYAALVLAQESRVNPAGHRAHRGPLGCRRALPALLQLHQLHQLDAVVVQPFAYVMVATPVQVEASVQPPVQPLVLT